MSNGKLFPYAGGWWMKFSHNTCTLVSGICLDYWTSLLIWWISLLCYFFFCRKNMFITDSAEIAACLQEGNSRLEMALHYKIPYPRPVNVPPNFVPTMKAAEKQKQKTHEAKPIYVHSLDSWWWTMARDTLTDCDVRCVQQNSQPANYSVVTVFLLMQWNVLY